MVGGETAQQNARDHLPSTQTSDSGLPGLPLAPTTHPQQQTQRPPPPAPPKKKKRRQEGVTGFLVQKEPLLKPGMRKPLRFQSRVPAGMQIGGEGGSQALLPASSYPRPGHPLAF